MAIIMSIECMQMSNSRLNRRYHIYGWFGGLSVGQGAFNLVQ